MACCDTCPYTPTCEEMAEFLDQIGLPPADEHDTTKGTRPDES